MHAGGDDGTTIDRVEWPFLLVLDSHGRSTGWAVVNGPIVTTPQHDLFARLRRARYRLAGISSYLSFPHLEEPDPLDYEAVCEAWFHCFREPDLYLSTDIPRALVSVSDFTDYRRLIPREGAGVARAESWDFVYAGASTDWKRAAKGWSSQDSVWRVCARSLDCARS